MNQSQKSKTQYTFVVQSGVDDDDVVAWNIYGEEWRIYWGKSDEILMEFIPWRGGHKGGTNSIEMRNKTQLLYFSIHLLFCCCGFCFALLFGFCTNAGWLLLFYGCEVVLPPVLFG